LFCITDTWPVYSLCIEGTSLHIDYTCIIHVENMSTVWNICGECLPYILGMSEACL
jgi:hypothetical protein